MKKIFLKSLKLVSVLFLIFFVSSKVLAATNYVSKTGGHISPFDSWENAATNIQAAVYAASSGDMVLVTNGTYYPRRQIFVTNNIIVKSLNGAENTIVDGGFPEQTNRCFYLNSDNTVNGLIITNGYAYYGGGVFGYDGGKLQSCTISGNWALEGGGVYCRKEFIFQNCIIRGNVAYSVGGGVYSQSGGLVESCTISRNSANDGGGMFCHNGGTFKNCTISYNSASDDGGGLECDSSIILNCTINENLACGVGGGVHCGGRSIVQNCIIIGNSADLTGGGMNSGQNSTIQNCSIIRNNAPNGGGVDCSDNGTVQNCILWNNIGGNHFSSSSTNVYNCIEKWAFLDNGIITNNPQFISSNNFQIQSTSPCRNIGTNEQYVFNTFDLDGNSRIMGTTVDMGAYEYVEAIQYPPATPVVDASEIDLSRIQWMKTPRTYLYIAQEQFGGTQGIWATIYTGTNTSLLIQQLTTAYYRVVAYNSFGSSSWSEVVFYTNYPVNVTSLNVEQVINTSGYVSIQTKIQDQNLEFSDLKVEYSLNNGASWLNGDPFLVSIIQSDQSPTINNSSEYQANNILPNNTVVTLIWDTVSTQNGSGSLANQKIEQAKIRITPKNAYSVGNSYNSSFFEIDNTIVSKVWIAINHNDKTTTSPNVSLQLHAEGSSPLYMRISRAADFRNSVWESYSTSKSWKLSPSSGIKTVYIQYKNAKGYVAFAQTSIFLDNRDFTNFEGTNDVTFFIGRSGSVADEAPVHTVNITTASMYKTEISNFEFAQFVLESGYANDPYSNSDSEPVVGISYYEAESYCNWSGYELPTEAQWEYFAKNGDNHYPWADDFWYTSSLPNYNFCNWKIGYQNYTENGFTSDGAEFTRNVTSYSDGKGHCGHYNLSGNVAEWVKDWYGTYPAIEETDPEGPLSGTERVVRGGSFVDVREDLTTTRRMHYPPEFRTNWLGMRVAKNDAVPEPFLFIIYYLSFLIYYLRKKL